MSGSRWIDSLWPGLPALWRGDWSGFVPAAAFAALLNATLLSTLVWTEMVSPSVRWSAWGVVAFAMLVSVGITRRQARRPRPQDFAGEGDLFPAALSEYLKGNWVEVERQLEKILAARREDLEARLLLATVFRRTSRPEDARKALAALCGLDGAVKWSSEIQRELRLLEEITSAPQDASANVDPSTEERRAA